MARLVTGGPCRFTRNPSSAAFALTYAGVAALVNPAWPRLWLSAVLAVVQRGMSAREARSG